MDKEIKGIVVEFEDGTTKRIEEGCCVDLKDMGDNMSVEMLHVKPIDIVQLTYGLMVAVERMGMTELLKAYVDGNIIPDITKG